MIIQININIDINDNNIYFSSLINFVGLCSGKIKYIIVKPINQIIYPKYLLIDILKKLPITIELNNTANSTISGTTYFVKKFSISYNLIL